MLIGGYQISEDRFLMLIGGYQISEDRCLMLMSYDEEPYTHTLQGRTTRITHTHTHTHTHIYTYIHIYYIRGDEKGKEKKNAAITSQADPMDQSPVPAEVPAAV